LCDRFRRYPVSFSEETIARSAFGTLTGDLLGGTPSQAGEQAVGRAVAVELNHAPSCDVL
jgi:hypothetical protein